MDCLRDLQDTFNNLDNKNIRGAALVASAKYDNIRAARGNAKLAGYNQKEVSAPAQKFDGTPVTVLSMDDFKDVIPEMAEKFKRFKGLKPKNAATTPTKRTILPNDNYLRIYQV